MKCSLGISNFLEEISNLGRDKLQHARGQGQRPVELPHAPRSGAAAKRSNPTSKERWLPRRRRAKRSYSTFKVRRGGREEILPVQGNKQRLRFAGAAIKRDPSKRNPSKTVGVARGHQRADTLTIWPFPWWQTITEKKCKKAKWLSEEALQIAVKWREAKSKGERERYSHLNAEFQRIARRDKKAFLSNQCKEIEENCRLLPCIYFCDHFFNIPRKS